MDVAALKESWGRVAEHGTAVPHFFYSHLFLTHPALREMFPLAMAAQRDKLVGALGRIVSSVDQLDGVVDFIAQLGRDHRRFSVVADHYGAVGASLLATLQHFLGERWTPALAGDWAAAYGVIAKVMVEAAEESYGEQPAWWHAEVVHAERRTIDVAVLELRPQERLDFVPGQSVAVEFPQRPRAWRYYSPANAPREDATLELHVQVVGGGQVSAVVAQQVRPGDVVRLGSAIGTRLTVPADDERDLLLVAGGTGWAPMRSVLEGLALRHAHQGRGPQVEVFHGVRMPWDRYDRAALLELAEQPWLTVTEVVSEDPTHPGTRGLVGSVAAAAGPWTGRRALVCGSPEMVRHTVRSLTDAGLPPEDVSYEQFDSTSAEQPRAAVTHPLTDVTDEPGEGR